MPPSGPTLFTLLDDAGGVIDRDGVLEFFLGFPPPEIIVEEDLEDLPPDFFDETEEEESEEEDSQEEEDSSDWDSEDSGYDDVDEEEQGCEDDQRFPPEDFWNGWRAFPLRGLVLPVDALPADAPIADPAGAPVDAPSTSAKRRREEDDMEQEDAKRPRGTH